MASFTEGHPAHSFVDLVGALVSSLLDQTEVCLLASATHLPQGYLQEQPRNVIQGSLRTAVLSENSYPPVISAAAKAVDFTMHFSHGMLSTLHGPFPEAVCPGVKTTDFPWEHYTK